MNRFWKILILLVLVLQLPGPRDVVAQTAETFTSFITGAPADTALVSTDMVPCIQGGITKSCLLSRIASFVGLSAGSVTSVNVTIPGSNTLLTSSGGPITSSGSISVGLANQNANCVVAGPSSGSATSPTCRGLVAADLPATVPETNAANVFSAPQSTAPVALTWAPTVNVPLAAGGSNSFTLGLTGNVTTLANPTGNLAGTYFCIRIKQPASGGPYAISGYGSYWQFPGGTLPVLSTGANAVDILCAWGATNTEIDASLQNAFAP